MPVLLIVIGLYFFTIYLGISQQRKPGSHIA
jgi:hypothetical protein